MVPLWTPFRNKIVCFLIAHQKPIKLNTSQANCLEFISKAVQYRGIRKHITENSQRNPFKKKTNHMKIG